MSSPRRRVVGALALAVVLMASGPGAGRSEAQQAGTNAPGPGSAPASADPWIDTGDRNAVVAAHRSAFAVEVPPIGWTGSHGGCDAGTSNPALRSVTLDRVNYYRAMAGVPATVVEEPSYSAKAQRTALMMSAEGSLTHSPTSAFACFTPIGQEGAANSNLYLGRNGPAAIDGYIEDPGPDNVDVGHRNTILHPPTRKMGVGDIEAADGGYSANALWVFDDRVFDEGAPGRRPPARELDRFVAWPPRGFVPPAIVYPRWSFTLAGADFSGADVAVHALDGGVAAPIRLTVVNRSGAPGHVPLPTIVWEPELPPPGRVDRHYLVVVSGVAPEAPTLAFADPTPAQGTIDDGAPIRPAYAYVVRILGDRPSGQLDPSDVLGRITPVLASAPGPPGIPVSVGGP